MPRADARERRRQLLDAGQQLAQHAPLARLRVDDIVAAAGLAKGTFYLHFPDRAAFLVALHQRFHDTLMRAVQQATLALPRGLPRLLAGSVAYLDGCLREHGVKTLLVEARAEPVIQAQITAQNTRFAGRAALEFGAAGWPDAAAAARLWVGMVAEAALAEAEQGGAQPALRAALARFLGL